MPNHALPVVTLTCSAGHEVRTRARGGNTVRCPECKKAVYVPVSRRTTEDESETEETSFAQRWQSEPEFSDEDALSKSTHHCETCGSDLYWEPGRTMLICPQCETTSLPPTIGKRYTEIEVRKTTVPDPVARIEQHQSEMRLRMRVSEERDRLIRVAESWAYLVDPDRLEDDSPLAAICVGLESNLQHIVSELKRMTDPHEIVAAKSLLVETITKVKEHETQIRDEHSRTENDEDDEDDYEDEDEDENDYIEGEVVEDESPPLSAYQRHLLANQGQPWNQRRPAIAPARNPVEGYRPLYSPPSANEFLARLALNAAVKRTSQKNCEFDHFFNRKATRKMWGSSYPGELLYQGRPVIYCCEAHNDAGIKWLESQGYPNSTFEMLEET